jgi:hypothetical protein
MNRPLMTGLAGVALVALSGIWFLTHYDLEPAREWQPPQGIVWRDRFLACERFLTRMGLQAKTMAALESVRTLDRRTALILPARRGAIAPGTLAALREYVARGGHLIVESERYSGDDPVFETLGIARDEIDEHATSISAFELLFSGPLAQANRPNDRGLVPVRLEPGADALWVFFSGGEALSTEAETTVTLGEEDNLRMLQFRLGEGLVTAVNDIEFAENWQIGRNDNAEFLWRLLQRTPALEAVAIYRGRSQALGAWLWTHAAPVLGALALLVLVLLWRALPRLGPVLPDPEPGRRRMLDHLSASGQFLWSAERRNTLLHAAARRAMAEVVRRYPHVALMPEPEQAAFLSERFGLAPLLARQLASASFPDRRAPAMIQLARACAEIHQRIAHHAEINNSRPLPNK